MLFQEAKNDKLLLLAYCFLLKFCPTHPTLQGVPTVQVERMQGIQKGGLGLEESCLFYECLTKSVKFDQLSTLNPLRSLTDFLNHSILESSITVFTSAVKSSFTSCMYCLAPTRNHSFLEALLFRSKLCCKVRHSISVNQKKTYQMLLRIYCLLCRFK